MLLLQIYVQAINWMLMVACVALVGAFKTSAKIGNGEAGTAHSYPPPGAVLLLCFRSAAPDPLLHAITHVQPMGWQWQR
jgi:hypothetical protein